MSDSIITIEPPPKTLGPITLSYLELIAVSNGVVVRMSGMSRDGSFRELDDSAVFNDSDAFAKWMREWHAKCLERGKAT